MGLDSRAALRAILAGDRLVTAAPIFDPLSGRIADSLGWELCKLTGSSVKAAGLALTDDVPLTNTTDLAASCRQITAVCDVPIIVDADDGGGNAVNVWRAVRDLEAAGAAAIELEDSAVPPTFAGTTSRHSLFVSREQHAGKLEAAVAARRDESTVIIARTRALELLELDEAMARIESYAKTGAELLYLPGHLPRGRQDIEDVSAMTGLPISLLRVPADVADDTEFLARHRVVIRTMEQSIYGLAVKAIYDGLEHLRDGGAVEDLKSRRATPEMLKAVNRVNEFTAWEERYVRD